MRDIDDAMGATGVELVLRNLHASLVNPTGFYESQIVYDRSTKGVEVNDSGVIYGPWLEGTGSRNQTTHFKGYGSFRKATQQLNAAAELVANTVIDRAIGQLQ